MGVVRIAQRQRGGQLRRREPALADVAAHDAARAIPALAVCAGRDHHRSAGRTARGPAGSATAERTLRPGDVRATFVERARHLGRSGDDLLVDALVEERALLGVGDGPHHDEPDRGEHDEPREQPGA